VVFAHDGLVGILTNRAPLLTQLGIGPLKVETGAETHLLMIDGGFAQMVDNKLTLLTEQATRASEIDRAEARRALEEAMARQAHTAEEYAARRDDIERARTLRARRGPGRRRPTTACIPRPRSRRSRRSRYEGPA
jgi:F-type H+-transporting ATPase subunit epsilon